MSRITQAFGLVAALCAFASCADTIHHDQPDAGPTPDAPPQTGKVQTTRGADGTYTTIVDATSMSAWTYADFETGGEVAETAAWDLRFQRFHISTNGGASGAGGVQVAPVTGTTFAALTAAPTTGFVADAADANGDGEPDYAFEQGDGWYDYDPATHILGPKPIVWVVKTDGGATLKLELARYYDDAGTSGWFTAHWGPL
jgi:hypothetical protein